MVELIAVNLDSVEQYSNSELRAKPVNKVLVLQNGTNLRKTAGINL